MYLRDYVHTELVEQGELVQKGEAISYCFVKETGLKKKC
jgi:hypothetical protein